MIYLLFPYDYSVGLSNAINQKILKSPIKMFKYLSIIFNRIFTKKFYESHRELNLTSEFNVVFVKDIYDEEPETISVTCYLDKENDSMSNNKIKSISNYKIDEYYNESNLIMALKDELRQSGGEIYFFTNMISPLIIYILNNVQRKKGFYWSDIYNQYLFLENDDYKEGLYISRLLYDIRKTINYNSKSVISEKNMLDKSVLKTDWERKFSWGNHTRIIEMPEKIIKDILLNRLRRNKYFTICDCTNKHEVEQIKNFNFYKVNKQTRIIFLFNFDSLNFKEAELIWEKISNYNGEIIIEGYKNFSAVNIPKSYFELIKFPSFDEIRKTESIVTIFLFLYLEKMKASQIIISDYRKAVYHISFLKLLNNADDINIVNILLNRLLIMFNYNVKPDSFEFWYYWQKELSKINEDYSKEKEHFSETSEDNNNSNYPQVDQELLYKDKKQNESSIKDIVIFKHVRDDWVISGNIFDGEVATIDYSSNLGLLYMLYLARYYDVTRDPNNKIKDFDLYKAILSWRNQPVEENFEAMSGLGKNIRQAIYDFSTALGKKNLNPKFLDVLKKIHKDFSFKKGSFFYKNRSKIKIDIIDNDMEKII